MFKHEKDSIRLFHLHPLVLMVLFDMKYYCDLNHMRFNVTSTMSTAQEDKELGRRSSSHRTGRAFDLSLRQWDETEIKDFLNYFNEKYKHIAAFSKSANKTVLVVRHNSGHGDHLHVQINLRYSKKELTNMEIDKL